MRFNQIVSGDADAPAGVSRLRTIGDSQQAYEVAEQVRQARYALDDAALKPYFALPNMVAMLATALAPTGALMTFIALWTGALWGKPTWGTWWVWDARLTSELILLFLYLGFIALKASIENTRRADKAGAILALVGVVNVPIIYFSVKWWNTLHQGASVSLTKAPAMAQTMLWGMLLMALCFWMYSIAVGLMRARAIILEREAHTDWVRQLNEVKR